MKRFIIIILSLLLLATMMSGCKQAGQLGDGKISVVCTIFPQYDWVRQILGNKADTIDLTFLLDSGIDLHNYQPTVDDIAKISACDMFIYVGGESDEWVDDALEEATNPDMIVIGLLDTLGAAAKQEELLEGMEEEEEEEEEAYDEHVWLSLKNAEIFCGVIANALSSLDADNNEEYKSNLAAYTDKLRKLDAEYSAAVGAAPVKTLLFGDRFPFRYLADDYNIGCYAAFPGCSAETEASFKTIVFLAEKTEELNLKTIMVTENSDKSIAETVIANTNGKNQQILVLDAMQSVTEGGVKGGTTYLSIMENNLNVLKDALK